MRHTLLSHRSMGNDLATLFLRLLFGGLFFYYGLQKLMAYDQILPMFSDIIGIGAKLSFNLVIFAELVCGALVLIGLFTRLSVIPIFITMIVAYFIAHAKDPFQVKQTAFIFLMLCIPVFILGGGRYSVDRLLFNRKQPGARRVQ